MEADVPGRVSDAVTRESDFTADTASLSTSLTSCSQKCSQKCSQTVSVPSSSSLDEHADTLSLIRQSAHKSARQQSSSTKSFITSHHHRNNSTLVIPPPTRSSSQRPPEIPVPTTRRPSSSSSPSPSPSLSLFSSHSPFTQSSYFSPLSPASGLDPRYPPTKRQPASRSSHGIETSTGPPPALITRRSYTAESVRKHPTPIDVAAARPHRKYPSEPEKSVDSIIHQASLPTDDKNRPDPSKTTRSVPREAERARHTMAAAATAASGRNQASLDDDQDSTLRNLDHRVSSNAGAHAAEPNVATNRHGEEQSMTTQEDLFLILARSNSFNDHATDAAVKSERRRVSVSLIYGLTVYPSWQHLGSIIGGS